MEQDSRIRSVPVCALEQQRLQGEAHSHIDNAIYSTALISFLDNVTTMFMMIQILLQSQDLKLSQCLYKTSA